MIDGWMYDDVVPDLLEGTFVTRVNGERAEIVIEFRKRRDGNVE